MCDPNHQNSQGKPSYLREPRGKRTSCDLSMRVKNEH